MKSGHVSTRNAEMGMEPEERRGIFGNIQILKLPSIMEDPEDRFIMRNSPKNENQDLQPTHTKQVKIVI